MWCISLDAGGAKRMYTYIGQTKEELHECLNNDHTRKGSIVISFSVAVDLAVDKK